MTADDGRARDERRASRPSSGQSGSGPSGSASGSGRPEGRRPSSGPSAAAFAGVGLQLGMTLTLFALLGHWLDGKLGTSPWLLILLVFVGAGAGFYSVYRRVIGPGTGAKRSGAKRPGREP